MTYRQGTKNIVPEEPLRCTPNDPNEVHLEYGFYRFEVHALVLNREQSPSSENAEEEKATEEDVVLYDIREEQRDHDWLKNIEDTPVPIRMTDILDAQRADDLCKETLYRKDPETRRIVEKRRSATKVSPHKWENIQSVIPEVLHPRFLILTHHCKS